MVQSYKEKTFHNKASVFAPSQEDPDLTLLSEKEVYKTSIKTVILDVTVNKFYFYSQFY